MLFMKKTETEIPRKSWNLDKLQKRALAKAFLKRRGRDSNPRQKLPPVTP